jgi:hypothetical protein
MGITVPQTLSITLGAALITSLSYRTLLLMTVSTNWLLHR